ncbi:MAG TPA: TolC family protein [Thermoanaerobaculia bacterium]|nr:TolC family protein [Thermoanaerobaculia bacterium]
MRRFSTILFFLAAGAAAAAEPPAPAGTVSLTLTDAIRRALQKNTSLAIERLNVDQATSAVVRAEGSYDLAWNLDVSWRQNTDPINSVFSGAPPGELAPENERYGASTSFQQLLPTGGSVSLFTGWHHTTTDGIYTILSPAYETDAGISLTQPLLRNLSIDPVREAIRVAKADLSESEAHLKTVVADTVTQVDAAYWNLVAARRDVVSIESSVVLADRQLAETRVRIEAGVLGETDIAEPTAELERRKGNLALARQRSAFAENTLKQLILGDPTDSWWAARLEPSDDPTSGAGVPPLEQALSDARQNRPEIVEAQSRRTRTEVRVDAASSALLPQLNLVANYARRGLAGSINPNAVGIDGQPVTSIPPAVDGSTGRSYGTIGENYFPDASVGLSLSLPIGNRSARANLAIAKAALSQASTAVTATEQQVEAEVRNAVFGVDSALQRIEATKAARSAAETQLYAEQEKFSVGLSTNFLVLTRQNDLTSARVAETSALTDYRKAETELARATGTLLQERRIQFDAPSQ